MGGAAGHMSHPFDLGWVNSGSDLLDFFEKARTFVEKKGAAAVKIDGVNVSFKLVGDEEFKQFAVDRGSLKPIDIEGITMSRVDDRFPEGHGMRPAIKTLLSILNSALGDIKPELEALGMWDDPSRFLNTEYVEGTTNVTEYDENFLAIHGLNQFYTRTGKVGKAKGIQRPGMERPEGVKDSSTEIPYDPAIMEKLVEKLRPAAEERGFQIYSSVPTEKMADIDYSEALSQPLTVRISDDREITKSLGEWLAEASNPRYKTVQMKDGKRTHALHKQLYLNILNNTAPIVDLIEGDDAEAAIYGAVFMHATRMLGNEVLRGLTSPMGDVMGHEGIVLRHDKLFGPKPVKVTGEFIVGNLGSGFGQVNEEEESEIDLDMEQEPEVDLEIIDAAEAEPTPQAAGTSKIAIVPGAFKPPHRGHLEMVEQYSREADQVIVLISNPLNNQRTLADGTPINAAKSKDIWELFTQHLDNVTVGIYNDPEVRSPMSAAYAIAGAPDVREAAAGKVEPSIDPIQAGTEIILGASTKDGDANRWKNAEKYIGGGLNGDLVLKDPFNTAVAPVVHTPEHMGLLENSPLKEEMPSVVKGKDPKAFHASDMRYLLGKATEDAEAVELLEDFAGGENNVLDILSILGIDTGLNEPLEETSAMGAGAVGGYSGPLGSTLGRKPTKKKKSKKKKKHKYFENFDLSLVDEVLELLIERGVTK